MSKKSLITLLIIILILGGVIATIPFTKTNFARGQAVSPQETIYSDPLLIEIRNFKLQLQNPLF
jgi:hypothetical protein